MQPAAAMESAIRRRKLGCENHLVFEIGLLYNYSSALIPKQCP